MATQPDFIHDTAHLDQHFLDPHSAERIVEHATMLVGDTILDIGAGTGVLTAAILRATPAHVIAVEPDQRCRPDLDQLSRRHAQLTVMISRIQSIPRPELAATTVIIANPPFSALEYLTRLLRELPRLRSALLCVSRTWAANASCQLGNPGYGATSLAVGSRFAATVIGQLDGSMFTPPIRRPAALLKITRRTPSPELDLFAEAVLSHGGTRLKDLVRSRRMRRVLGADRHHGLLCDPGLRQLQQRRLHDLSDDAIAMIATLLVATAPDR